MSQVMPITCPIQEEKRQHRRRAVTFRPKVRVLEIPTVEEMSEHEIASVWITTEESERNQADLVESVRAARKNPRDATICIRGIEDLIDLTKVLRKKTCRKDLIDAVLDNQEAQWERGLYHTDPKEIRSVATEISRQSVEEAIMLAAKDEAYIRILRRREMSNPTMLSTAAAALSTSRSVENNETEESKDQNDIATNITNYDRKRQESERT